MSDNLPSVISNKPVPITQMAEQVAESRFFQDALTPATALVKLAAGRELGLPMMSALQNIHVIKGKATLGYSLVAAMIRRHPDYDYRVLEHSDTTCTIQFLYRGDIAGDSTFTITDAQAAGLLGNPSWKKFPRNMLFARALTNGARFHCPDVFMGAVYTRDEIDDGTADIDHGDATEIVEADVIDISDIPDPVWAVRLAEAAELVGDDAARATLNGADPSILADDRAWERFQAAIRRQNSTVASPPPVDADAAPVGDGDAAPSDHQTPGDAGAAATITDAQLRRLFAVAKEWGIDNEAMRAIVLHVAQVDSRKLIPRDRFEACEAALVEAGEQASRDAETMAVAGEGA